MIEKLINTLKTVFAVLACILVPLMIGIVFIKSAAKKDATRCVDTFMIGETTDLSKYIALQFAHASRDVDAIAQKVRAKILEYENSRQDDSKLQKDIEKIAKESSDIVMVNLFDEYGELLYSSLGEEDNDIIPVEVDITDITDKNLASKTFYSLDELDNDDKDIVVRYAKLITIPKKTSNKLAKKQEEKQNKKKAKDSQKAGSDAKDKSKDNSKDNSKASEDKKDAKDAAAAKAADKKKKSDKATKAAAANQKPKEEVKEFFVEVIIKWSKYENYMMSLKEGVFPRMFYIVSPDCGRYISMNSLPESKKSMRHAAALGLHLVQKLQSIPNGASNVEVESFPFFLYKEEIKMPENMFGHSFFIIEAADDSTIDEVIKGFSGRVPLTIFLLIIIWFAACWFLAKFYNSLNEELEVSTTISTSTPLAITIFKIDDGKVIQINSSALSLFRLKKEGIDDINFWDMFMSEDDKQYISNAITADVNVLNYELLAQSPGGSTFWIVCSANRIIIKEQSCVIFAAIDVNQRKEMERKLANNAAILEQEIKERTADLEVKAKELETSNALLESSRKIADEANAAKTKFLANMSNELKTPINAIIGYSEILEEEARDRKDTVTADDLHKIISSARHLLSLIDEILDLSSIESGKVQLFFQNTNIPNLLKDVESVVMPLITENDNSFFIEGAKHGGEMYIDSTKLRQCLLNLLSNAAKYTQFGKVTLRVDRAIKNGVDFVEFRVIDTGAGIDPEKLEHIFETVLDESGASVGAGLGLSLTKKYADVMGGYVTVESEVGSGSKFTLGLPRKCTVESSDSVIVKNSKSEDEDDDDTFSAEDDDIEEVSSGSASSSAGNKGDRAKDDDDLDDLDDLDDDIDDLTDDDDLSDDDDLFEDGPKKSAKSGGGAEDEDFEGSGGSADADAADLDDEFTKALLEDDGGDLEDLDEDIDSDESLDDLEEELAEEGENEDSRFTGNTANASRYSLSAPGSGKKNNDGGGSFGRKSDL